MNPESSLNLQALWKFPVTMTKEMVADALGVATHNMLSLTRVGLIKPLGRPQRYCVKHYALDVLTRNMADADWLDKVAAAIQRHWRNKNARKRQTQPA